MRPIIALIALLLSGTALAAEPEASRIREYDGDTSAWTARLTIDRFLSFDTPETARRPLGGGAECDLEIERGRAAFARHKELNALYPVRSRPLIDSDGAQRTDSDGRLLSRHELRIDGEWINLGYILAREGLAALYFWQYEKIDWCDPAGPVRRIK